MLNTEYDVDYYYYVPRRLEPAFEANTRPFGMHTEISTHTYQCKR